MGATAETPEARPCEKHMAVSLSDDTKPATFDHPQFSAASASSVFPAMPSNNSRQTRKTVRYRTQLASDSHLLTCNQSTERAVYHTGNFSTISTRHLPPLIGVLSLYLIF